MMGFTPAFLAALKNSTTPNIVPWSVMATELMFNSLTLLTSFLMLLKPSSREYSVCT